MDLFPKKIIAGNFVVVTVFAILSLTFNSTLVVAFTFNNNEVPVGSYELGTDNNLVMDIGITADEDVFLDSDGVNTTNSGSASAIDAGDVLTALSLSSGQLCGDTDGSTAPSNIVRDANGDCTAGDESIEVVDSVGANGGFTSVQLDANGFPVVSYFDADDADLKLLHCNDVNCAGGDESIVAVDTTGSVGNHTSLQLDANGFPVVSYHYGDDADLKLLHCNDVNCAGDDESIVTVDSTGAVGSYTSLQLDANGFPVVAYLAAGTSDLKLLRCNDVNCAGDDESIVTVDTVGLYTSLQLDANDFPIVAYFDNSASDLKLLHCNDVSCAGDDESIVTVDSTGSVGHYPSLKLDADGFPVVIHSDFTTGDLKLLHCNDVNCAGGNESTHSIEVEGFGGAFNTLQLDANGFPVVAFYNLDQGDLQLLHCNDVNCAGGDESIVAVDSTGDIGYYTSLQLNASMFPTVSYFDNSNRAVKVAHCNDVDCIDTSRTVVLGVDTLASNDLSASGSLVAFVDDDDNNVWTSGEDLYFDTDESGFYNASQLNTTYSFDNQGTAVSGADIGTLKLWRDSTAFDASQANSVDNDCTYDLANEEWDCTASFMLIDQENLYATADLAASATVGNTLQFRFVNEVITNTHVQTITAAAIEDTGSPSGGFNYGCKDQNATNYDRFSVHSVELCEYADSATASEQLRQIIEEHRELVLAVYTQGITIPQTILNMFYITIPATPVRDLKLGMKGQDVHALQQLLNASGFSLTDTGPGSPGNETTYFGTLTQSALARYQDANGILPSVGFFGPITRAQMKESGLVGLWW